MPQRIRDAAKKKRAYWFGGPVWGGDAHRERLLEGLWKQHNVGNGAPGNDDAWVRADQFLYEISGRLTDKSAAVLQFISVLAAILAFLPQHPGGHLHSYFSVLALLMFSISAFLLWMNLPQHWPYAAFELAQTPAQQAEARKIWRLKLLRIIQSRTLRHTLALWIAGLGGMLFFGTLALHAVERFPNVIKQGFEAVGAPVPEALLRTSTGPEQQTDHAAPPPSSPADSEPSLASPDEPPSLEPPAPEEATGSDGAPPSQ